MEHDMSFLRRWWCVFLVENLGLEGYGRKFAHFIEEGKSTLRNNVHVPPVFRKRNEKGHFQAAQCLGRDHICVRDYAFRALWWAFRTINSSMVNIF
ncbi:unnamed protein product [Gadus morhua 'NCC']